MIEIDIDPKLLKKTQSLDQPHWTVWEFKDFNKHRGVVEFTQHEIESIDDFGAETRHKILDVYGPSRMRGLGFGVIIHLNEFPEDYESLLKLIDTRNRSNGVWQFIIACVDSDKKAVGFRTWNPGPFQPIYLFPVYESILRQLAVAGYACEHREADVDPLINKLFRIARWLSISAWLQYFISLVIRRNESKG